MNELIRSVSFPGQCFQRQIGRFSGACGTKGIRKPVPGGGADRSEIPRLGHASTKHVFANSLDKGDVTDAVVPQQDDVHYIVYTCRLMNTDRGRFYYVMIH